LIPPDVERFNWLFDTALKSSALDTDDRFGLADVKEKTKGHRNGEFDGLFFHDPPGAEPGGWIYNEARNLEVPGFSGTDKKRSRGRPVSALRPEWTWMVKRCPFGPPFTSEDTLQNLIRTRVW
jgi:hypothetical protein